MLDDRSEMPTPPWHKPRKARRGDAPKRPLTTELIVATAVRVLDAEGADALTMRRIAQELGTGAASLYAHISNKDELLEQVLDRIAGEIRLPVPDPSQWQEQLKQIARETRRMYRRHGDIARASLGTIPTGPNQLKIAEFELGLLRAAGIPPKVAALAVDKLHQMVDVDSIEGDVLEARSPEGEDPHEHFADRLAQIRAFFAALPADRFPNVVAMVDELTGGGDDERFEFGLDILVRGIASHVQSSAPD